MLDVDLCVAALDAATPELAIAALSARLLAKGHVLPSFERAAIARERRSPTGLPFPDVAVALPHAEPEHVVSPAIAFASLARPISFRQMGSPATKLDVRLIVVPALTAKEQATARLSTLIELLQDPALRVVLSSAKTDSELLEALRARWTE
jgi:galactitol PTS system EIIA component